MALTNVKLVDKEELTLPANGSDYVYIKREVAGGGFGLTDYKINVRNLKGDSIPYGSDGVVPDAVGGTIYFNTTDNELRAYDGTNWNNIINRSVKVTLSAAQIKSLGTTPVELIPAAGADTYIKVLGIEAFLNWNSVAFDDNVIIVSSGGFGLFSSFDGQLISSVSDANIPMFENPFFYQTLNSIHKNMPIELSGTDSVATGDSTLDLYIRYNIVKLESVV